MGGGRDLPMRHSLPAVPLKMESAALQVHCISNSVYFSLPPCIV